ncbi:Rrf2 family transcriptional regulator [Acidobacteria bacterium AB60]|nr:Rrf2 family transcriptional regulator [Acidobacteria bacterium AB60]
MKGRSKTSSSMQLTRAADYGVRVMMALAGMPPGERVSLQVLTRETGAPESFLSKVLQSLAQASLIASRRGQGGGFEIAPAGREASIRTIVEAVDGPIGLNVCLCEGKECQRKVWCPAHPVWAEAQRAMFSVLERTRMQDLAEMGATNQFTIVAAACLQSAGPVTANS